MQRADFFHADTNSGRLRITLIFIGWAWALDHETLKSGVIPK